MRRVLLAGLAGAFGLAFATFMPTASATAAECQGENCTPAAEGGKRGCGRDEAATS